MALCHDNPKICTYIQTLIRDPVCRENSQKSEVWLSCISWNLSLMWIWPNDRGQATIVPPCGGKHIARPPARINSSWSLCILGHPRSLMSWNCWANPSSTSLSIVTQYLSQRCSPFFQHYILQHSFLHTL